MAFRIRADGALRTPASFKVYDNGALRSAATIKMQIGGSLELIATFQTAPSASTSPTSVSALGNSSGPEILVTNSTTVSVTGGLAPFSYSWVIIAYTGNPVVIGQPTNATTTFRQTIYNAVHTATARCTVTDASARTATCDVSMVFDQAPVGPPP